MTDEQLRILVGAIMYVEGALVEESMSYASRFIDAARASSPPAPSNLKEAVANMTGPKAPLNSGVSYPRPWAANTQWIADAAGLPIIFTYKVRALIAAAVNVYVPYPHTDSPDCQCADCLKRDARRWRVYADEFDLSGFYQIAVDEIIAADDAKEQSK